MQTLDNARQPRSQQGRAAALTPAHWVRARAHQARFTCGPGRQNRHNSGDPKLSLSARARGPSQVARHMIALHQRCHPGWPSHGGATVHARNGVAHTRQPRLVTSYAFPNHSHKTYTAHVISTAAAVPGAALHIALGGHALQGSHKRASCGLCISAPAGHAAHVLYCGLYKPHVSTKCVACAWTAAHGE